MKQYTPPVIEELANKTEEVEVPVTATVVEEPVVETITPNSELAKNYFSMVDTHFRYLNKEIGFATKKARYQEQIGFMAITGRSLSYNYDEFEQCALYLIQKMRESNDLIVEGKFLRFVLGVEQNGYPASAMRNYELYTTYLSRIAKAWPQRSKVAKLGDMASLSQNFPVAAQENLNLFMRKLISFKI